MYDNNQLEKQIVPNLGMVNFQNNSFGDKTISTFPYDFVYNINSSIIYEEVRFEITGNEFLFLEKISNKSNMNLLTAFAAFVNILLYKYTGNNQIAIGTSIFGENEESEHNSALLSVSSKVDGRKTIKGLLKDLRQTILEAVENLQCIYDEGIDVIVTLEDIGNNEIVDSTNSSLIFSFYQNKDKYIGTLRYNSSRYKSLTVNRLVEHLIFTISQVSANIDIVIDDISILTPSDKELIIFGFNNTKWPFPKDVLLHQFFEMQVEKSRDSIAVIAGEKKYTYNEINEKANRIAHLLRAEGIKSDDIIAVKVERSLDMIVGLIGILKSGAAYLPIDVSYPAERIKYIIENSGAKLFLTQSKFIDDCNYGIRTINLNNYEHLNRFDTSNPEYINSSGNLAYVIYTSGSTGKPKGVMIEHRSIVNRINWMQNKYPISCEDVILQKTPYTFDVSVWELFWWFFAGAKVCLLNHGGEKEPQTIVEAVRNNSVSVMHFVPSMLKVFLDYVEKKGIVGSLERLAQVFASGEALKVSHVNLFNQLLYKTNKTKLINLYGPTEAAVDVSYFDCWGNEEFELIPIGKPIENIRLYIMDEKLKMMPVGVVGELCIAGIGLARGYLNRPELTKEKFVENPYIPGEVIYKTGDIARWLPDGNVEYIGRKDFQVKIRGFRIELGEIESLLMQYSGVQETAIIVKKDKDGNDYISAYYVSKGEIPAKNLRDHLVEYLPDYMIPKFFTSIEKMPLNSNGKLDRNALPDERVGIANTEEDNMNISQVEDKIREIWSEVLQIEKSKISVNDNFFNVGGDSFNILEVNLKVNEILKKEVPLVELYQYPTIREFAIYLFKDNDGSDSFNEEQSIHEEEMMDEVMQFMEEIDNE